MEQSQVSLLSRQSRKKAERERKEEEVFGAITMKMYDDDKALKLHYTDWVRILPTIIYDPKSKIKEDQVAYRVKLVSKLIKDYKDNN